MDWTLEVVVLPDGNSWAVQEIRARAQNPLIPEDHAGLRGWAGAG